MGNNYLDVEPGNEFWNHVQVASSCYKSLLYTNVTAVLTTVISTSEFFHPICPPSAICSLGINQYQYYLSMTYQC